MRRMYSKKQIKEQVKQVVSSGEVDIVAKTLKQTQPNWSATIETFPNITGCTASPIYCKIHQINGELHIIMIGQITNETESAISGYATDTITIELPTEIASKLLDLKGGKASETPVSNVRISYDYASASSSDASDMSKYLSDCAMNVLNLSQANKIGVLFQRPTQITIQAGATLYLESRVSLDLI